MYLMAQKSHMESSSIYLEVNMKKAELLKKLAHLESINDHLLTELSYVDHLMKMVGFAEGLQTVKVTAQELYLLENSEETRDIDLETGT